MFKMSEWLLKRTARVRSSKQRVLAAIARQLGSVIVVVATFTLGYVVKNMEDHGAQHALSGEIAHQRETLIAECNARIVHQDQLATDRMRERDLLLADQAARLQDQTALIQALTTRVDVVAERQAQGLALRKAEVHAVTKAATKAAAAATVATVVAVDVAKKALVTEDDRKQINAAAKGAKK